MDIVIAVVAAAVAFPAGAWVGIRVTARNADRLLAAMSPEQLTELGRRTRARKTLLDTPASR